MGRWILHDIVCQEQYECSACHVSYVEQDNINCDSWKYCPNCGDPKLLRARWVMLPYVGSCECSNCKSVFNTMYQYCPQCGRKMD